MANANEISVGDFIEIPAWRVHGQVTALRASDLGSEDSITVMLQERPEGPERSYRLEPDEYIVID